MCIITSGQELECILNIKVALLYICAFGLFLKEKYFLEPMRRLPDFFLQGMKGANVVMIQPLSLHQLIQVKLLFSTSRTAFTVRLWSPKLLKFVGCPPHLHCACDWLVPNFKKVQPLIFNVSIFSASQHWLKHELALNSPILVHLLYLDKLSILP